MSLGRRQDLLVQPAPAPPLPGPRPSPRARLDFARARAAAELLRGLDRVGVERGTAASLGHALLGAMPAHVARATRSLLRGGPGRGDGRRGADGSALALC